MHCSNCGTAASPTDQFCRSCGSPVRRGFDRWAPVRLAAVVLGTSLALALVFGLASRPSSTQLTWGFKSTLAWVAWVWESLFGVGINGHGNVDGSFSLGAVRLNGTASGSVDIGAMPLTLTIITLLIAAAAYRRAIKDVTSRSSALLLGACASALVAVPLILVSLAISLTNDDLHSLIHSGDGNGQLDSALRQWESLGTGMTGSLSLSTVDAALVPPLLLMSVFIAVCIGRAEWFGDRLSALRLALLAPIRGTQRLAIALVVGGLIFELATWLVRWNTGWPHHVHAPAMTFHQWVTAFAGAIAYAGNAGAMALGLGSFGSAGYSGHLAWSALGTDDSRSVDAHHGISWLAQTDHLAGGVWIAVVLAPLTLAFVARSVMTTRGVPSGPTRWATWLLSLALTLPLLAYLAGISATGDLTASSSFLGLIGGSGSAQGSASAGLTMMSVVLILGYAVLICAALGRLSRTSATGTAPSSEQS